MNTHRVIHAAIDCVTQFQASRFPLKNVASEIIARRKLNSKERKLLLDLVFRFSREINLISLFIAAKIPYSSSMTLQQKNALALEMLAKLLDQSDNDDELKKLAVDYEQWCSELGEKRHLLALGNVVGDLLSADYSSEAFAIACGLSKRPAKYFAVDQRKITVQSFCDALSALKIAYFRHPKLSFAIGTYDDINKEDLPLNISQAVWLMDAGSQIIAELINPKASDRVLDLCAGEGNKACYITMKDCQYVAVDIDGKRLQRAKSRLADRKIEFIEADGRNPPFLPESFEWILLDAPCSGIGVIRRHPDLIHRLNRQEISNYIKLQRSLLNSAINLLKPGGVLIYATCSLLRAENEQQIQYLLSKNNQIMPMLLKDLVGAHLRFNRDDLNKYFFTLFPHIDDCDGFYFAALRKRLGTEVKGLD